MTLPSFRPTCGRQDLVALGFLALAIAFILAPWSFWTRNPQNRTEQCPPLFPFKGDSPGQWWVFLVAFPFKPQRKGRLLKKRRGHFIFPGFSYETVGSGPFPLLPGLRYTYWLRPAEGTELPGRQRLASDGFHFLMGRGGGAKHAQSIFFFLLALFCDKGMP